jgi:hypothetical protein
MYLRVLNYSLPEFLDDGVSRIDLKKNPLAMHVSLLFSI